MSNLTCGEGNLEYKKTYGREGRLQGGRKERYRRTVVKKARVRVEFKRSDLQSASTAIDLGRWRGKGVIIMRCRGRGERDLW